MTIARAPWSGQDELAAPSSLMSSRWSRDNLLTSHPARLYNGKLIEHIDTESLTALLQTLDQPNGPIQVGTARMGVYTWDIACADGAGPFILQVPVMVDDDVGTRGRARGDIPWRNVEHARAFIARGLTRFLVTPRECLTLGGNVKAATFAALPEHRPITFGGGGLRAELSEGKLSWQVALGPRLTAELLAEMAAAIVYHYEPDEAGGTTLADLCINDGDFVARRRVEGGFDVRLMAARQRETRIGPPLLLLYLIQLMAYEDWGVDGKLIGLPVLISNPSVAFEGVVRGLRYRYRDLGRPEEQGRVDALRWIEEFGRSRDGRAYRPWTERFLAGALPLSFGADPRERWWRLMPLQAKLGVLELHARQDPTSPDARSAAVVRSFLDRLAREIGRVPHDDPEEDPKIVRFNELGPADLLALFEEVDPQGAPAAVVEQVLAHWPYRGLDHLLARVPGARALRRWKSRLSFGQVVSETEQGTLKSLGAPLNDGAPARALANPEVYGGLVLPPSLHAAAVGTFPTFEAYMDAALHDPRWGYYGHGVTIGSIGHFNTNPEDFSPHYGAWMAAWAFRFWGDLVARGALSEADAFFVIEFGAGNGRLARDILDAVAEDTKGNDTKRDDAARARWRTFASRLRYRIYETSESLRTRQRTLVGDRAQVAPGDARHPAETLARDFPDGLKGLVLTNEVPDAFGVQKVVLTAEGAAFAALVVPRVESRVRVSVGETLARRIDEANATVRATFGWRGNPDDFYLDGPTYAAVMEALSLVPLAQRWPLLGALWFQEVYVPVAHIAPLASHLGANAAEYATALAAEDTGIVAYVNVHASRFIRQLASSLAAGFVVTIDYGDTTFGLVRGARRGDFPFRVYGDWSEEHIPRPNDPYTAPGTQDMTADVNFTELTHAGQRAGLHLLHFGPERDVTGAQLPELLRTAAERPAVAEFIGNPLFKVLVLGTHATDVFSGPLMTSLSPWGNPQDVAKARRPKIAELARSLASLAAAGAADDHADADG